MTIEELEKKVGQLEATVYGNGEPQYSMIVRVRDLEKYACTVVRWGRIIGTASLGMFVVSFWNLFRQGT